MTIQTRVVIVDIQGCHNEAITDAVNGTITEWELSGWELRGVPQYYPNEYMVWLTFETKISATADASKDALADSE